MIITSFVLDLLYLIIEFQKLLSLHAVHMNIPFTDIFENENGPQNKKYLYQGSF